MATTRDELAPSVLNKLSEALRHREKASPSDVQDVMPTADLITECLSYNALAVDWDRWTR